MQGLKEAFMNFLQRLTSAVNRMIPISEARQIMEFLTFEIASFLGKSIIRPLKEGLHLWRNGSEIQLLCNSMNMKIHE